MAMIKFLCPNGHPLNSPPNLIGKAGKCPKCGTAFIVPSPDDDSASAPPSEAPSEAATSATNVKPGSSPSHVKAGSQIHHAATPEKSDDLTPVDNATAAAGKSSPAAKSSPSATPKVETFYFLCPNGHKLNGPVTLKGKLGQCPHCGSKFHIPEDNPEEEVPEDEEPEYHSVDEDDSAFDGLSDDEADLADAEDVVDAEILDLPPDPEDELLGDSEELAPGEVGPSEAFRHYHAPELDQPEYAHPLAEILAKLWSSKGDDGEVELTLEDNTKYIPDFYSPKLSQREFAVFATYDGVSYTLHSFPWKSIRRLTVNKVDELPAGLFEVK